MPTFRQAISFSEVLLPGEVRCLRRAVSSGFVGRRLNIQSPPQLLLPRVWRWLRDLPWTLLETARAARSFAPLPLHLWRLPLVAPPVDVVDVSIVHLPDEGTVLTMTVKCNADEPYHFKASVIGDVRT